MPEKILFESIKLQNFLSFGPEPMELELKPLNILIGPNGSGKSNLIETIDVMRSTPVGLQDTIREKGGISQFIWKGALKQTLTEIVFTIYIDSWIIDFDGLLNHQIGGTGSGFGLYIENELIFNKHGEFYYKNQKGQPMIKPYSTEPSSLEAIDTKDKNWTFYESILKQRRDPTRYPQLTEIAEAYQSIRIYRNLNVSKDSPIRKAQSADYQWSFLDEDATNLALVLNHLESSNVWERFLEYLQRFYEPLQKITTKVESGSIQIYLHEKGLKQPIPATRFSDGFLRFLCLQTILMNPEPPPLICIEEPELGMHPDSLPILADLLREASERSQLIVTTHSDVLVDAFSDEPDAVVVCEKEHGSTKMKRLDHQTLSEWLQKYALGELWRMGEIGGKRW